MNSRWIVLMSVGVLSLATSYAPGVNKVWAKAGGTGNWTASSNWTPSGVPLSFDNVFVTVVNPNPNVVLYDEATFPFLKLYGSILINSSGAGSIALLQQANNLSASALTLGAGGGGAYDFQGGYASFGTVTLNPLCLINIGASANFNASTFQMSGGSIVINGTFSGGNFTQGFGTVFCSTTISLTGSYNAFGGTFDGGSSASGRVNAGTFVNNVGTFNGSVDAGRLIVNGNGTFLGSVTNRSSITIPSAQALWANNDYYQVGGVVTQNGLLGGRPPGGLSGDITYVNIGGGAVWNHSGGSLQGTSLLVGSADGTATYNLSGAGSTTFGNVGVGVLSDGTAIQTGGTMKPTGLTLGGLGGFVRGAALPPGRYGYYSLSGGSLLASGLIIGPRDSLGGTFVQTGGVVQLTQFTGNFDSTSQSIVNISGGSFSVGSASVNNGSFNQTGGIVLFSDNLNGAGTVSVTGNGSFSVDRIRQNAIFVGGNGRIGIGVLGFSTASFAGTTSRVKQLKVAQAGSVISGTLDLGSNDLIVDYDDVSPASSIRSYLVSGRAGGAWNGTGLASASAALTPNTALGYAEASAVLGPTGGVFGGVAVDSTAVLVKFTHSGDANLDGQVDISDLARLATSWQAPGNWVNGDFDYSGFVDVSDLAALATNWQKGVGAPLGMTLDQALIAVGLGGGAVPEPALLTILAACHWLRRPHRVAARPRAV